MSPFEAHAWAARGQKGHAAWKQLWSQSVYNSVRGEREEKERRGFSTEKSPTKHIMRAAMKDELFRERRAAPAAGRKWPFSPTKCSLLVSSKERDCHSR